MKAALFREAGKPLTVEEIPTPQPGAGEALVRVAGCGMCHTDLHYLDHGVKPFKTPPLVLGHEIAGTVAEVGAEVTGRRAGDRVLIPSVYGCGRCGFCRRGRENLCADMVMLGNHIDGGYAEFVVVPASELIPVPASLPLERASVIADALSTPFHAVRNRARVRVGESVVVVGCGGVGLNVVQCAVAAGGRVIAVDLNEARLDVARTLGAFAVVNPGAVQRVDKQVRELTDGGAEVVFEAIGDPRTMELGFSLLRKGGRMCVIGYSQQPVTLSAARLMYYELEVMGSLGCGAGEYPDILELVAAGRLTLDPIVSGTIPLADINAGLDRLRRGEGVRWVVVP
jgi:6-hydroxycyclohex-1-ene-1-carbonyl-CoA dehydrogenase